MVVPMVQPFFCCFAEHEYNMHKYADIKNIIQHKKNDRKKRSHYLHIWNLIRTFATE